MQTNNLEIREELKKLLNITQDLHLVAITKTVKVINDDRGFLISFRGTNSFRLLIFNTLQLPVISQSGQGYPNLSGLLLKKIRENSKGSAQQLTNDLRDSLLQSLKV